MFWAHSGSPLQAQAWPDSAIHVGAEGRRVTTGAHLAWLTRSTRCRPSAIPHAWRIRVARSVYRDRPARTTPAATRSPLSWELHDRHPGELCERKPQNWNSISAGDFHRYRKSHNRPARIRQRHRRLSHRSAGTALTCALVPLDPCNGSKSQPASKIVAGASPAATTISAKWSHDSTRSISPGRQKRHCLEHPPAMDFASSNRRHMKLIRTPCTASRLVAAAVLSCCTPCPGFRILSLTCGAKGIRTSDLLHAMQVRRCACQGISGFRLRR